MRHPHSSYAKPSELYGRDPAKFVRFQRETEEDFMEDENLRTKQVEAILADDIENWVRWGRKRDWMPSSFRCPLGFLYKSTDVHEASHKPAPCDGIEAVRFERVVISLPERHRQAFVMYHLERAAINGMVRIVKGYNEAARLMGMQKTRYYEILGQAHNMVLYRWRGDSALGAVLKMPVKPKTPSFGAMEAMAA